MEDEINLLEYWQIIVKRKKIIFAFTFLITLCSVGIVLRLPNIYKATAVIMPINQKNSSGLLSSAISGGLGGLLAPQMDIGSKGQLLVILASYTLAEEVLTQYKDRLLEEFYPKQWDAVNQKWKIADPKQIPKALEITTSLIDHMKFTDEQKRPIIKIDAAFKDPILARDIANGYVANLEHYLDRNTLTTAQKNRVFIENSLENNNRELLEAGKELTKFYESNIISKIGALVDVNIEIAPPSTKKDAKQNSNIIKNVPQQVYLQYLTERKVTLSQLTNLLASEHERAKIEENKENLSFQVIDPAQVPIKKIKPRRAQLVILSFVVGLFVSMFMSLLLEKLKKKQVDAPTISIPAPTTIGGRRDVEDVG